MNTLRHFFAATLPIAAFVVPMSTVFATDGTQTVPGPFDIYWGVAEAQQRTDINLRGAPMDRRVVIFNRSSIGKFPKAGPHMIELHPGGREAFYAEHDAWVRYYVEYILPDPNYSGIAVIDYEWWAPYWTMHPNTRSNAPFDALDEDWIDDWRDYIREHRPGVLAGLNAEQQEQAFKTTWLEITREFFTRTIREAKRLRPNATWGFYNLPDNPYWAWASSYGPYPAQRAAYQARNREEMGWLSAEVDAVFPCLYTHYETRDPWHYTMRDAQGRGTDSLEMNEAYFRTSIQEYELVANGKKVLPFIWYYYHSGSISHNGTFVNPFNLERSIRLPQHFGADGVIFWGWIPDAEERQTVQSFADTSIFPVVSNFVSELNSRRNPPPPPAPPEPVDPSEPPPVDPPSGGGGSGGGGDGSGGSGGSGSGPNPPPSEPTGPGSEPSGPNPPDGGGGSGGSGDAPNPDNGGSNVNTSTNVPPPPSGGSGGSGGSGLYSGGLNHGAGSSSGGGNSGNGSSAGSGGSGGSSGGPVDPSVPSNPTPPPMPASPSPAPADPAVPQAGGGGSVSAPWLRRNSASGTGAQRSGFLRAPAPRTTVVAPRASASSPRVTTPSTSARPTARVVSPTRGNAAARPTTTRSTRSFAPSREAINAALRRSTGQ